MNREGRPRKLDESASLPGQCQPSHRPRPDSAWLGIPAGCISDEHRPVVDIYHFIAALADERTATSWAVPMLSAKPFLAQLQCTIHSKRASCLDPGLELIPRTSLGSPTKAGALVPSPTTIIPLLNPLASILLQHPIESFTQPSCSSSPSSLLSVSSRSRLSRVLLRW